MRMRFVMIAGALTLVVTGCTISPGDATTTTTPAGTTTTTTAEAVTVVDTTLPQSEFLRTVDTITAGLLGLQPELVTELGAGETIGFDADYLLNDLSLRGQSELAAAAEAGLAQLAGLDAALLSPQESLSADVLSWYLNDLVVMAGFVEYENPVNFITGAHATFSEYMADVHPIGDERDAENYVDRLAAFPTQVRDLIARLEDAAAAGIVPTDTSLGIARWQIQNAMAGGDAAIHPLVADFQARVEAIPDENASWAAGIGARATAIVEDLLVPALEDLEIAVRAIDGRPNAAAGVVYQPGGEDYYAAVLRHFITVDMTPQEVHEVGLVQIDRVVGELTVELDALGYDAGNDFARAVRQAAADAGAMPTTGQRDRAEVLARTETTVDEAATAFAEFFTVRPEAELDVVRPRPGREGGSGAYYRPPTVDGTRSGVYYLSLGGAEFPTLTMDTTTYHEGIPGHHFQLSVQRALDDVPLHQRVFDFAGYAEGWALYAERLAYEAGLYDDNPLGNIGRLRMELLRAARMVVDSGIHWAGWSRNDAIDYMLGLGFHRGQVEAEVDRYIVWPGQAPAYMVGMLEILRLRDQAVVELGDRFDIVGFHDAILSQGSVPVALLEEVVGQWIESVP